MASKDKSLQLKRAAFLAAYSECGTILHAAEKAQVSRQAHYEWLASDPDYAEAFKSAREEMTERMEREAIRRAIEGTDEPVFQGGQLVGYVRKYSDTLLIFMLKANRPDVYRDNHKIEHTGRGGGPIEVKADGFDHDAYNRLFQEHFRVPADATPALDGDGAGEPVDSADADS